MLFSVCSLYLACDLSTLHCFCFGCFNFGRLCLLPETRPRVTQALLGLSIEMNHRWSTRFFQCFKTYLESKLDEKTKQLESKSKLDKQVTQMKFKGNQKQFELNAQIDCVFDRIRAANDSKNKQVDDLANEGKELIRKRQKLIRIADKSADGWKVVDEYVSDELASGSEDEKRLKKAKEAASKKRRQPTQGCSGTDKKLV